MAAPSTSLCHTGGGVIINSCFVQLRCLFFSKAQGKADSQHLFLFLTRPSVTFTSLSLLRWLGLVFSFSPLQPINNSLLFRINNVRISSVSLGSILAFSPAVIEFTFSYDLNVLFLMDF